MLKCEFSNLIGNVKILDGDLWFVVASWGGFVNGQEIERARAGSRQLWAEEPGGLVGIPGWARLSRIPNQYL